MALLAYWQKGVRTRSPRLTTHIQRKAALHDCLPGLLGVGDTFIEIVCREEKNNLSRLTRAAKAEQKSLVPARQAKWTNQGGTPFICTPQSPVTSVSTVGRGPPLSGPSAIIKRGLLNFILFQEGGGWGGGAWGIGDGNSVCNGIIVDLFLQVPMTVIST